MPEILRKNVRLVADKSGRLVDSTVLPVSVLATKTLPTMLAPKSGERVLLLTDVPSNSALEGDRTREGRIEMLGRWKNAIEQMNVPLVGILAYEETGGHGAPLPQTGTLISGGTTTDSVNIVETLSAADIQLALTKFSATAPLKFGLDGKRRAVSMPGVDEAMEPAMSADYGQIAQQIDRLLPILGQFDKYTIVFTVPGQQPHILEVDTRERHFHGDDGFCREPGKLINFPAGEVYIAPFEGVGTRTRGRIPVFFDAESPVPVLLTVESNLIVLDGATLAQLPANVREDLQRKPGNVNIAEIALGLNPNTRIHPATPTLELEKSLGFHWAYGISAHLGGAVDDSTADVHQDYVYSARDPRCSINVYGTGPAHSDPVLIVSNGLPVIR